MAFCKSCGAQIADTERFCTACGAQSAPESEQQTQQQGSAQGAYAPPAGGYYDQEQPLRPGTDGGAAMSTWGFVGALLLMAIPVAGFILAIVWACGGTENKTKRNLARANLILTAIGLVLSILLAVLLVAGVVAGVSELQNYSIFYSDPFMANSSVNEFFSDMGMSIGGGPFVMPWNLGVI